MDSIKNNVYMTSKERITAFTTGKEYDRIPCMLLFGEHGCRLIDIKVSEYHHSAKLMAEAEISCFEEYKSDGVGVGPGLLGISEAMGTKLRFPDYNYPFVEEPILNNWADFEKLNVVDPYKDGRLPIFLEALDIIKNRIGKEVPVGTGLGSPFTVAATIRGTALFLRDMTNNNDMAHKLMELATESCLRFIDAVCDRGFLPGLYDPVASLSVISVSRFKEFAKPYIKKCTDRIIERSGASPMLHICGKTRNIWPDMVETGAGIISLDNIEDLSQAKKEVGSAVCLHGNVPPVDIVMKGTDKEIREAVKTCILKAFDNPGGYILGAGCMLPIDTPSKNIHSFMDAVIKYGKMPINPKSLS